MNPLTLTHWGAYRVAATASGIVAEPFEHDPDPSPIGKSLAAIREARVESPCVRRSWLEQGPGARTDLRGREPFVEVDWPVALDLAANEIERVRSRFGNEAIYGGSYGWSSAGRFHHAQSLLRRFLTLAGGFTGKVNTYSHAAGEVLIPHVLGMSYDRLRRNLTPLSRIAQHTDLVIAFGGIPRRTSQIQSGGIGAHTTQRELERAAESGTRFVNISPLRSDLDPGPHVEWVQCRPGSDTATILGMVHTLLVEELVDREFLDRYTSGWDRFEAYVLGSADRVPKTAEWASAISGIPCDRIVGLAREAAKGRTMITAALALQRAEHGEQPWWAVIALAAALGQIGLPGGGFGLGYGAFATIGNGLARTPLPSLPSVGSNPVDVRVPVARITDMLLNPGEEYEYDGGRHTYPDIHLIWWAGGNPFHHQQDLGRLDRAWAKPDTVIVNEPFWTATARRADIVFPTTTPLERNDIGGSPGDAYLFYMKRAIEPVAKTRDDYEIFAELARRLGFERHFTQERSADEWIEHLYEQYRSSDRGRPSFPDFMREGYVRHDTAARDDDFLSDYRNDPTSHALGTPSGRIEVFSERIASFGYDDCPGHPAWLTPTEWSAGYPLHIISNQPQGRLHSQLDHGEASTDLHTAGRETILISEQDAGDRSLETGDLVRVYNERGACVAGVVVSEDVTPGVGVISTGAWFDPDPDGMCRRGNVNVLTPDTGTSRLAQGSSAQTCLAEVERLAAAPEPGPRIPEIVVA